MDRFAAIAAAHAPTPAQPPRRDIDCILAHGLSRGPRSQAGGPTAVDAYRWRAPRRWHAAAAAEEKAERLADAGLIQFTALHEGRTETVGAPLPTPAPARPWRCRVCQVECGGRDGFREHCMSDEHYAGLQLFALHSDLFTDRPNM